MARVGVLQWVVLLTVVMATATSAEGWVPSIFQKNTGGVAQDQVRDKAERAKSWTNWLTDQVPYFSGSTQKKVSDSIDATKDSTTDAVGGAMEHTPDSNSGIAQDYVKKSTGRLLSTKDQVQEATVGFLQRWSSWAKNTAGNMYGPAPQVKSPASVESDAAAKLRDVSKEASGNAKEKIDDLTSNDDEGTAAPTKTDGEL